MTTDRVTGLRARFEREFGAPGRTRLPRASGLARLARAPGRVNLIGEHTDYNGLPVFPMAIQRDIAILFRARDDARVRVCNADERYAPREFEIEDMIAPFAGGDWGNYAKCAAQALRRRAGIARGIDAAVHGDIPSAAGLSSSSAMVVATALALMDANRIEIERSELMSLLAEAERYIGTQSGGMDQAISLGGRRGEAVMIEFDPLRLAHVPVPASWRFVIANTLVRAEKSGAAQSSYNERTRECREAWRRFAAHPAALKLPRNGVAGSTPPASYPDLVREVPVSAFLEAAGEALSGDLLGRFRHVTTEGKRVAEARDAMLAGDIAEFGRLMNASHASLRDDYEVSCGELDRLVDAALSAGAHGARLTGAGFGGCIVALSDVQREEILFDALRREIERFAAQVPPPDAVMLAEPSDGASVSDLA
jgi:galactokinase